MNEHMKNKQEAMNKWQVLTGLLGQPSTALDALAPGRSWQQAAPCPRHGQDTGLPASGGRAGLRLSRGGEQCAVLLLEGKVLESPHGQGCAQALPGESRGRARKGRGASREAGFSGPGGQYPLL